MSILVDKNTKVIVQGFTGKEGTFHATQCLEYGTKIVGGVTPNKGGQTHLNKPVFNTVKEAVAKTKATVSMIFVPPAFVGDAVMEAASSGIELAVIITEGAPVKDMQMAKDYATKMGMKTIGPNCPGIITADECKIGIMPGSVFKKGQVGLISKSGTLTYEGANQVCNEGYGISTAVGIGGDPIIGLSYIQLLEMFEKDDKTKAVVMIGEIGGDLEIQAAKYIKDNMTKPVVAFIAGQTAPKGKTMGHAGAIVSGSAGTAKEKMDALKKAGVKVVISPADIGKAVKEMMENNSDIADDIQKYSKKAEEAFVDGYYKAEKNIKDAINSETAKKTAKEVKEFGEKISENFTKAINSDTAKNTTKEVKQFSEKATKSLKSWYGQAVEFIKEKRK